MALESAKVDFEKIVSSTVIVAFSQEVPAPFAKGLSEGKLGFHGELESRAQPAFNGSFGPFGNFNS
jgi:hypothetical protein